MTPDRPAADELSGGADRPPRLRRAPRRTLVLGASLLGLVLVVPAALSAGVVGLRPQTTAIDAQLRAKTGSATTAPAAAPALTCPTSTTPQNGGGYAIAITAEITGITLNNGWNEKLQQWQSVAENISAQACGLLHLPSLRVDIPLGGLAFDTSKAHIFSPNNALFNPTSFSLKLAPTGPASNTITGVQTDGRLDLAATTPLLATVLPGSQNGAHFKCPTASTTTLSTGQLTLVPPHRGPAGPRQAAADGTLLPPWTVAGSPLSGPSLIKATAQIAGNSFALPVFDSDPALCDASGTLLNVAFGGADANGVPYDGFGVTDYGPVHPAGTSWAHGTLTITGVDPKALPNSPPKGSQAAIVPDCVPKPGPPFQLGVVGAFSGPPIRVTDGVAISKLDGTLCGTATVIAAPKDSHPRATVCTELRAPGAGQQFANLSTTLNLIPGVTSVISKVGVHPEDLVADFCDDQPDGQLVVNATVTASAVPDLFGTGCLVGPLVAPSTGTLSGPLSGASVRLVSPPFRLKAVLPGPGCPAGLATNTNQILHLPLAASTDGLTIDTTAGLYLLR